MAATNRKPSFPNLRTAEGAAAHVASLKPINALRRSVLANMLWEDGFYEDGHSNADRIAQLVKQVTPAEVAALAREARGPMNLRHVPLLLVALLADHAKGSSIVHDAVGDVVRRTDELAELLAIRQKMTGLPLKKALTHGLRKGLARAFLRFDEYQLAKYNRAAVVKLRDVMRIVHPRPRTVDQAQMWKRLLDDELATPDTVETGLSGGGDRRETLTRMLTEDKLGGLALLRNLRNMVQADVDLDLIRAALDRGTGFHKVLPFRFVAAARAVPQLEPDLDRALLRQLEGSPKLPGRTAIIVDVSYSMRQPLSARSDINRMDAAATLASMFTGDRRVFVFSEHVKEVPPRLGMAGIDAIKTALPHENTYLGRAVLEVQNMMPEATRLLVITDEQSHDPVPDPHVRPAYMINCAGEKHGVGYGPWTHMDGFSEQVLRWIAATEGAAWD